MKKNFWQIVGLLGLFSAVTGSPAQAEVKFEQLSPAMISSMEKQREFVADLVEKNIHGKKLNKSPSDFTTLQEIVNKKVLSPKQTWELQALGICFGDALTSFIPGLNWILVTDEYGTDPTLRYRNSSLQINALTMISKRIEGGEDVNIAAMAEQTKVFLAERAKSFK